MIRNRFSEICRHLKSKAALCGFRGEQFEPDVSDLRVEYGGHGETLDGYHFANFRYDGLIYIERVPEDKFATLAILIKAWLDTNDGEQRSLFKLPPPAIETVDLGDGLLDVLVRIEFVDPVYLTPDPEGEIEWCDTVYTVGDYPVDIAESAAVGRDDEQ